MKNIEFINSFNKKTLKYAKTLNDTLPSIFTPYDYQNEILSNLDSNRFIAIQQSRQMGLTTIFSYHVCNFLFNNKDERKIIYFKTGGHGGKDFINKIRIMVNSYLVNINNLSFDINNSNHIKLTNGNEIRLVNSNTIKDFNHNKPYSLIIDNAAFVDGLNELVSDFMCNGIIQIILNSGKIKKENQFYNTIFTNQNSLFMKMNIDWKLNPTFTSEWYDKTKKLYGEDIDGFDCEVNLFDVKDNTVKITNKNRIINVRLDDELLAKVSSKLINQDISISEYIRKLINKDI